MFGWTKTQAFWSVRSDETSSKAASSLSENPLYVETSAGNRNQAPFYVELISFTLCYPHFINNYWLRKNADGL